MLFWRSALILILISGMAKPPAYGQGLGSFVPGSTLLVPPMVEKNQIDGVKAEYLRGFASYVSAMVFAQGLDLRERIQCLRDQNFRQSQSTCQDFLAGEFKETLSAFMDLRRSLALATTQSVSGDLSRGVDHLGAPLGFSRGPRLAHLFDRYRLDFISSLPPVPPVANLTEPELRAINNTLSARARVEIEAHYRSSGLDMAELILEEQVQERRSAIDETYELSDKSFDHFEAWDRSHRELDRELEEHYANFRHFTGVLNGPIMSHQVFKALGEIEQQSEVLYYQALQRYPALAFLQLDSDQISRLAFGEDPDASLFEPLAQALETSLRINEQYFAHLAELQKAPLGKLMSLMELRPLVEEYFNPEIHQMDLVEDLVSSGEWRELKEDLNTMAVGLVWGLGCGAILTWGYGRLASLGLTAVRALTAKSALTIQCALTAGLTLNAVFYGVSNSRYQTTFKEFFSVAGDDLEGRYQVLQEVSQLELRDQMMLFESIFLFVGSGLGEVARQALSPGSRQVLGRWFRYKNGSSL